MQDELKDIRMNFDCKYREFTIEVFARKTQKNLTYSISQYIDAFGSNRGEWKKIEGAAFSFILDSFKQTETHKNVVDIVNKTLR